MKSEQILDLSSGFYDKFESFFGRKLTLKEKYELEISILQVHSKYPNILDEFEYIIQRRLNEEELRNFVENQYDKMERRLGKLLTEKQLRNILYGKYDSSLNDVEDLRKYFRNKYDDDQQRTQRSVKKLIEELDKSYKEQDQEPMMIKSLKSSSSSRTSVVQQKESTIEFDQTTNELLEQLNEDIRKHTVIKQRDSSIDSNSPKMLDDDDDNKNVLNESEKQEESVSDKEITPISISPSSPTHETESIKAFENIPRIVEQIAEKERIEEMTTVINAIDKFQEKLPKTSISSIIDKPTSNETIATWLTQFDKQITPPVLPAIKSINDQPIKRESYINEDRHLGWTLFKGADRPDLGLKDEKPRMINVKHQAQTYVVGIPEEYADERSKSKKKR